MLGVERRPVVVDERGPALLGLSLVQVDHRDDERKPALPRDQLTSLPRAQNRTPGLESIEQGNREPLDKPGHFASDACDVALQGPPAIFGLRRQLAEAIAQVAVVLIQKLRE